MKSTCESLVEKAREILHEMIGENCDKNIDEKFYEKTQNAKRKAIRTRNIKITVFLSDEEYAQLRELQEVTDLSASEIIRRRITGTKIFSRIDEKRIAEIRKIGGLIKHAAEVFARVEDKEKFAEIKKVYESGRKIIAIAEAIRHDIEKDSQE